MGELHLEVTVYRIVNDYKVEVITSPPIVVYRETVDRKGGPFEGKSPNKHNKFYIVVEPLEEGVIQAIIDGEIPEMDRIKDRKTIIKKLEDAGLSRDEAKKIESIRGPNILLDMTWGVQYLNETMELVKQAFFESVEKGPLANEKLYGVKVKLMDAKLHEDAIHRGPAQTIPAVRNAIKGALLRSKSVIFEPMQNIRIDAPNDVIGGVTREVTTRRGVIEDMPVDGNTASVIGKMPIAESFGFSNDIRAATQGRAIWNTENSGYVHLPAHLFDKVTSEIRERKGLKAEIPGEAHYMD